MTKLSALALIAGSAALAAQQPSAPGVPVPLIVTVEARHGKDVPQLNKEDFMAYQRRERLKVAGVDVLQGEHAGMELYILVDDAADSEVGLQFDELKKFIREQPETTAIGLGYMRNTTVDVVQKPTPEHGLVAAALRLPLGGGAMASPWLSLRDLVKRWPVSPVRREVIVVTSGTDPLGGFDYTDPYLSSTIEAMQRAGVVVYAIYTAAAGHAGHSPWLINMARNHLARLAEETGGESYMLGFEEPVSFSTYFADIASRLTHQYRVTVLMKPEAKAGLQDVRFVTEVPNAELISASRGNVPASRH